MATLTVLRNGCQYLTVVLTHGSYGWVVDCALDEMGTPVVLTHEETVEAIRRASEGEDDTGR